MTEKLPTDKGLFYVVEFYDGIQIIPDSWVIEDESLAYWPKIKSDQIKILILLSIKGVLCKR